MTGHKMYTHTQIWKKAFINHSLFREAWTGKMVLRRRKCLSHTQEMVDAWMVIETIFYYMYFCCCYWSCWFDLTSLCLNEFLLFSLVFFFGKMIEARDHLTHEIIEEWKINKKKHRQWKDVMSICLLLSFASITHLS